MKLPVDSSIELVGTGNVSPAPAWAETADGGRQRAGQARSEAGHLLWQIETIRRDTEFGRDVTVVESVTVPAAGEQPPRVQPMAPVKFEGLMVSVNPRRSGGLSVRFEATAVNAPAAAKAGQAS